MEYFCLLRLLCFEWREPALLSFHQGVKTTRYDKDGLTECCGNLKQLVFLGGVEEA